jgi:hypothetical protein
MTLVTATGPRGLELPLLNERKKANQPAKFSGGQDAG